MMQRLNQSKQVVKSSFSLCAAMWFGLPGIRFDVFGRRLALKSVVRGHTTNENFWLLLNPVSSIRYFEFDFARRCLEDFAGQHLEILDISSPRIWPLWARSQKNLKVTMLNPDKSDLLVTKNSAAVFDKQLPCDLIGASAIHLPFADNSFDLVSSISVIEHIADNGDVLAMREFARVLRPGGKLIITFPVHSEHFEEFRPIDIYGVQKFDAERKQFFFQRFYDEQTIQNRLLLSEQFIVRKVEYIWETPVGWFDQYIQNWKSFGYQITVNDPLLMAKHFSWPHFSHPRDRMGNCHLYLESHQLPIPD